MSASRSIPWSVTGIADAKVDWCPRRWSNWRFENRTFVDTSRTGLPDQNVTNNNKNTLLLFYAFERVLTFMVQPLFSRPFKWNSTTDIYDILAKVYTSKSYRVRWDVWNVPANVECRHIVHATPLHLRRFRCSSTRTCVSLYICTIYVI
jgi:hypothetical protein